MKKLLTTLLAALLCFSLLAGCGGNKKAAEPDNFFKTNKEISYVMIYNPNIYDQLAFSNENLTTGDLAAYVEAISQRADGLDDEINAANIEGGGRVIAALKNGEFEVPEDADNGLVYIGLNSEFEVVTDYIIK